MTVTRTNDMDRITKIVASRFVYPWVSDDFSPKREDFRAVDIPSIYYLIIEDEDETLGCFTFVPQNGVCYEVHTCLLPVGRGYAARTATALAAEWIFANTPCKRIITNVPEDNPLAREDAEVDWRTVGRRGDGCAAERVELAEVIREVVLHDSGSPWLNY